MLVVSRKVGERILIGDKVAITVIKIGSSGVRIGVEAPKEMPVVRQELAEQLRKADLLAIEAAQQATSENETS